MQNILAHFIWSETGRKGGRERRSDRERKGGMGAEIQRLAGEGGVSSSWGGGGRGYKGDFDAPRRRGLTLMD